MTDDIGSSGWAETTTDPRLDALSIAVVQPIRPDPIAVLKPREALGSLTVEQSLDRSLEIEDYAWGSDMVQIDEIDSWTVLIEPNGWVTAFGDALSRLSEGGRAANVLWNVNANMRFGWAVDGRLLRLFDPLLYDAEGALPEEAGLPFGHPGSPRGAALALMTRLTGVVIDPAWLLDRARPTFVVPLAGWSG
jgi:uncharacterized protein DUF6461